MVGLTRSKDFMIAKAVNFSDKSFRVERTRGRSWSFFSDELKEIPKYLIVLDGC